MSKPIMIRDSMSLNDPFIRAARAPGVDLFSHMGMQEGKFPVAGVLFEKLQDDYGNEVLKPIESNTVVVGGAITALEKLAGVKSTFNPTTLNTIYGINSDITGTLEKTKIALFGCGTGGAALDFGNIIAPDIKQNNIKDPVPMRYTSTLSGTDANKYYMKKLDTDGLTNIYYMKEFDSAPIIRTLWKNAVSADEDGTEIVADISGSPNTEGIESFLEINISLNHNDVREYFEAKGQVNLARYNTFGFYTGERREITTGVFDYVNVSLFSVVTFNNRDVSTKTMSNYVYRVYSLI